MPGRSWDHGPVGDQTIVDELRAIGLKAGLEAVGVASAEPFADTLSHLRQRRDEGLHGDMAFTYRNPERSTDPGRIVAGARSLVVGSLRHAPPTAQRPTADSPSGAGPIGRVAAYATTDHYARLRSGLEAVAVRLRTDGWTARVVADDNALVDRAAAHRAGLGWYGKSSNLLGPDLGSWFVLGSVVTDADLPTDTPVGDGCGACTRCVSGCPTGAIVAPGVVDARRCLAWLVQAAGAFPRQFRADLGDRLYGCDECQVVCPPNRGDRSVPVFMGDGAMADREEFVELLDRFGRWYIPERQPRYLRRNALVVLGNVGDPDDERSAHVLARYLAGDDPMLAAHGVWAARRLGRDDLVSLADPSTAEVADELAHPTPSRATPAPTRQSGR